MAISTFTQFLGSDCCAADLLITILHVTVGHTYAGQVGATGKTSVQCCPTGLAGHRHGQLTVCVTQSSSGQDTA